MIQSIRVFCFDKFLSVALFVYMLKSISDGKMKGVTDEGNKY